MSRLGGRLALIGVLQALLLGSLAAVSHAQEGTAVDLSCPGCNVILLNVELLRADFVGLSSRRNSLTPNIDRFFRDSIVFEDVMASSGITAISNTSTLTAIDGHVIDPLLRRTLEYRPSGTPWPTPEIPRRYLGIHSRLPTIAEILRAAGYRTIGVNNGGYAGRQMLLDRGFGDYVGIGEDANQENAPGAAIERTTEIIRQIGRTPDKLFLLMRSEDLRGFPYRYPTNRKRLDSPWVLYRSLGKPYFQVWYRYLDNGVMKEGDPPYATWSLHDPQLEMYQALAKQLYGQQLSYVDEQLGKLFDELERGGLLEKTIVVLYANHGDGLYDNRMPNHGHSYQSCVSVPVLIRHPKVKHPIRVSAPAALIGLVPTLYDMLSIPPPGGIDGRSLAELIEGKGTVDPFFYGIDKESQYVRHGAMKLIVWADRSKELYDLSTDPRELHDIAASHQDLVQALDDKLSEHAIAGLARALDLIGGPKTKAMPADR
jgi:arylsulfatase A-like enzyme